MNLFKISKQPQYIAQLSNDIRGFEQKQTRNYQRLISIVALVLFLVTWEGISRLGIIRPIFISSPTEIVGAAIWLFRNGFIEDILVSTSEFVLGFSLAVAFAIPLGLLLGWYRWLHAVFDPFISALYATPRIALLPIIILWLGIGIKSKIAIVFLGAIFPILINVIAGMRTIDATLLKCAYAFGANDRQIFRTLAIPNSIPFIIAGLRIGVSRALVGIVVGEFVASTAGIGHMMSIAGSTFQTDKVYVGIIFLAATALTFTSLLRRLEARFESWRPRSR
jgi:NitT/TauT family transport system permease protein